MCEFFIDSDRLDAARLLPNWNWLIRRPFRLLGCSVFGDLFLEDTDESVTMFDLVSGEVKPIATGLAEFRWGLGNPEQREEWLMVQLAQAAAERNLRPQPGQCLAFQTPPLLGGKLAPENLIVWDVYAYHQGLAQLFAQVLDAPTGPEIRMRSG